VDVAAEILFDENRAEDERRSAQHLPMLHLLEKTRTIALGASRRALDLAKPPMSDRAAEYAVEQSQLTPP
jgi:hypothetical protein